VDEDEIQDIPLDKLQSVITTGGSLVSESSKGQAKPPLKRVFEEDDDADFRESSDEED
jgi:hypothetical protein